MAVKMRLRREGKRKQPFYRVVVADARSPRDGRFIEDIGYYQPLREPSEITIDRERALYWLGQGVQPSDAVRQLLRVTGIWAEFNPGDPGRRRATATPAPAHTSDAPQAPVEPTADRQAATPEPETAAVPPDAAPTTIQGAAEPGAVSTQVSEGRAEPGAASTEDSEAGEPGAAATLDAGDELNA